MITSVSDDSVMYSNAGRHQTTNRTFSDNPPQLKHLSKMSPLSASCVEQVKTSPSPSVKQAGREHLLPNMLISKMPLHRSDEEMVRRPLENTVSKTVMLSNTKVAGSSFTRPAVSSFTRSAGSSHHKRTRSPMYAARSPIGFKTSQNSSNISYTTRSADKAIQSTPRQRVATTQVGPTKTKVLTANQRSSFTSTDDLEITSTQTSLNGQVFVENAQSSSEETSFICDQTTYVSWDSYMNVSPKMAEAQRKITNSQPYFTKGNPFCRRRSVKFGETETKYYRGEAIENDSSIYKDAVETVAIIDEIDAEIDKKIAEQRFFTKEVSVFVEAHIDDKRSILSRPSRLYHALTDYSFNAPRGMTKKPLQSASDSQIFKSRKTWVKTSSSLTHASHRQHASSCPLSDIDLQLLNACLQTGPAPGVSRSLSDILDCKIRSAGVYRSKTIKRDFFSLTGYY